MRVWPVVLLAALSACAAPVCGPVEPTRDSGAGVPADLPQLAAGQIAVVRLVVNG
jgi:hypothetical protein